MYSDRQVRTMRLIERDVGCKFTRISPPRVEDVLKASGESATEVIKRVHPEVAQVFMPTAEELLKDQGPSAFAAALAHLAGFTQLPASRSLITHEEVRFHTRVPFLASESGSLQKYTNQIQEKEPCFTPAVLTWIFALFWQGLTTLSLVKPKSSRPMTPRVVMGILSDIWQTAADKVGKIKIVDDPKTDGAVFDLPEDVAKVLLEKPTPQGEVINICKTVLFS
jgi:ATP-dependent RNA helicase DDX21